MSYPPPDRNRAGGHRRPVLWLAVAFATGVGVYFWLPAQPWPWVAPALLLLSLGMVLETRSRPVLLALALALSTGLAGFVAADGRTRLVASPVLSAPVAATVSGPLCAVEPRDDGARLVLCPPQIPEHPPKTTPARVRISVSRADLPHPPPEPGDHVTVPAKLFPPPGPALPGGFDFARHAWFQRLGGVGYATGPPSVTRSATASEESFSMARLRTRVVATIRDSLPGPPGAVAVALMTGERGMVPEPVLDAVRMAGMAHLLAISGLHMGLVAGVTFFALRALLAAVPPLALRWPVKKLAAVMALAAAAGYLWLTGAPVPTQRAFIMTGLVLGAVLVDRTAISMRLVAWAAVLVLLVQPENLLGPSFQMSFAAVVALVAIYEPLAPRLTAWRARARDSGFWWRPPALYLLAVALSTAVATAATAPYALFHFNQIAVYSLPANMLAVPLTVLWIMPWAVAAFALMPLGLAHWALVPMGWGCAGLIAIAREVAAWPGALLTVPAMPTWGVVVATLGGLWLVLSGGRWRWLGVPVMVAGLASPLTLTPPDVLMSADSRLLGVRGRDTLWLSTSYRARFVAERWQERLGLSRVAVFPRQPDPDAVAPGGLACVRGLCRFTRNGLRVALVRHPAVLPTVCPGSDVVVATVPVPDCPGALLVVDRWTAYRQGALTVTLASGLPVLRTSHHHRGHRPWVQAGE